MHKEKRRHFHAKTTSAKLNIYIEVGSRDLFIDKAHTVLDILPACCLVCFAAFFNLRRFLARPMHVPCTNYERPVHTHACPMNTLCTARAHPMRAPCIPHTVHKINWTLGFMQFISQHFIILWKIGHRVYIGCVQYAPNEIQHFCCVITQLVKELHQWSLYRHHL